MNVPAPTRPRQVTLAAWLIMGGSVLVVLTVFERMAGLHSLETRQSVEKFLAEPPADGPRARGLRGARHPARLRMVAAGCATAAAILGYQVLQRSRSARVALTVLAAAALRHRPGLRRLPVVGGRGLRGDAVVPAGPRLVRRGGPQARRSPAVPARGVRPGSGPDPDLAPTARAGRAGAAAAPVGTDPHRRPAAVAWACVLTWVSRRSRWW